MTSCHLSHRQPHSSTSTVFICQSTTARIVTLYHFVLPHVKGAVNIPDARHIVSSISESLAGAWQGQEAERRVHTLLLTLHTLATEPNGSPAGLSSLHTKGEWTKPRYRNTGTISADPSVAFVGKALIDVAIEELEELPRALRPLGWLVRYTLARISRIYTFRPPRPNVDHIQNHTLSGFFLG